MLKKLESAIDNTVKQFHDYSYFLSERDIQAILFVELRKAMSEVSYTYDAKGWNQRFGFTDPFKIHPVTTEYYIGVGKQDRFDVAVLSEESDSALDIWRQPCQIAIEIKLWQPGYPGSDYLRDVEKLRQYQSNTNGRSFTGIAMLFVHPHAKPLTRTPIPKVNSGNAYPENGVSLHFVTQEHHWQQQ